MLLRTHVQLENIPVPRLSRQSVDLLTSSQLENHVVKALRMRCRWGSLSPSVARRLKVMCSPFSRIVSLQFLPERENRWLLSLALVHFTTSERKFALQCWDLEASQPVCIATKTLLRFGSLVVNTNGASTAVLAVQSPLYSAVFYAPSARTYLLPFSIEIFTIDFDSTDPASAFLPVASFPGKVHGLHKLSGTTLLTRDDHGRLCLWDIGSPENQVELRSPEIQVSFRIPIFCMLCIHFLWYYIPD